PKITFWNNGPNRRNRFRARKSGDVLHGSAGVLFSPVRGKNQSPGRARRAKIDILHARDGSAQREDKVTVMNHTQEAELKKHEDERDIFCVMSDAFRVFARRSSVMLGSAWAFTGAMLVILVWILTGPTFHFSDTWQLIINTGTTIVTFLMVFLFQNTQNRDAKAMQLTLDEIIRALKKARNELVDLEDLSDEELNNLENQFRRLRAKAETRGRN